MRADTVRDMEQEIRAYIEGNEPLQEWDRIQRGYIQPVIVQFQEVYYALTVSTLNMFSRTAEQCMRENGYYSQRRIFLVPSCSNAVVRKAVARACMGGAIQRFLRVSLYEKAGDALLCRLLGEEDVLSERFKYESLRRLLLKWDGRFYSMHISTDTSFPPGVSEMHNEHDDPAVIERVKNHLLEHGYLAMDASVNISMTEVVEI